MKTTISGVATVLALAIPSIGHAQSSAYATVLDVDPVYSGTRVETVCSDNHYRYEGDRFRYTSPRNVFYSYGYDRATRSRRSDPTYPTYRTYTDRYGRTTVIQSDPAPSYIYSPQIPPSGATYSEHYRRGERGTGDRYRMLPPYETQRCWMEHRPSGMIVGYDVTYRYRGRLIVDRWNWAPRIGQHILVDR